MVALEIPYQPLIARILDVGRLNIVRGRACL
jgi:hypothetical protein